MEQLLLRYRKLIYLVLGVLVSAGLICLLTGCAVGRGPAGEIVVGTKVGSLPETGSELLAAASTAIGAASGVGWLGPVLSLLGVVGVGGGAHYLANRGRDRADGQYDEGYAKGILAGMARAYVASRPVSDPLVDPPSPVQPPLPPVIESPVRVVGSGVPSVDSGEDARPFGFAARL